MYVQANCVVVSPLLVLQGISGETLHMLSSEERVTLDGVVAKLSPEPRFLVVRPCDGTIAVCLFVPESAKPGVKMVRLLVAPAPCSCLHFHSLLSYVAVPWFLHSCTPPLRLHSCLGWRSLA